MAEQVLRLRRLRVRRPGRHDARREQAGQREAGGDEHRHRGMRVTDDHAVDGDERRGKIATPSAAPHCLVAVSSALAVPSDRAATGPWVSARVEETWLRRLATPSRNVAASSAGSASAATARSIPRRIRPFVGEGLEDLFAALFGPVAS